jgi:hypothetical protein
MFEAEQLLQTLRQCDDQLNAWINESQENAVLFLEDPASAMKAAASHSDLDAKMLIELEAVLSGLAHKLDLPIAQRSEKSLKKAS